MTEKPKRRPAKGMRRLRDAQRMYERWSKTLTAYLDALDAKDPGELGNARGHLTALTNHYKTLEKLLDLERDLDGRIEPEQAKGGGVTLDLAAARAEILERLARWDDGGSADAVS
ncbi:hypothetical protein LGT41_0014175 [Abyssibius alkaniclasticus]|uniref:hypothetical protein n=1 Tax=Abyssibius alkaniclasticus TaxID=2881234 RepID=UPI00236390C2|nr:hypothetical protein [Abyssibius alkaniclasticus]UPH70916.1 hypothetical protein LGT41_0014175 [Abyssibius alkaniclasticus]